MKKNRHRKLGFLLFVLYLVLLTYFLFFAEEMGRSPDARAEYSYNLTLFKEIRRFIVYRHLLGYRAFLLNVVGIWERMKRWYTVTVLGFVFSLCIETIQLVCRVGSFDVDDLLLNTIGALAGYLIFCMLKGVWDRYSGTDWE